jgi:hypothetical protein
MSAMPITGKTNFFPSITVDFPVLTKKLCQAAFGEEFGNL